MQNSKEHQFYWIRLYVFTEQRERELFTFTGYLRDSILFFHPESFPSTSLPDSYQKCKNFI